MRSCISISRPASTSNSKPNPNDPVWFAKRALARALSFCGLNPPLDLSPSESSRSLRGWAFAPPVRASSDAPLYVVVPFGEPGDTDPLSRDATTDLTNDLSDRRIRSAVSTPIDAIEAVGAAGKLCAQYRGDGVIVGQFKFEQSKERNLTGFIPLIGGVVSASGAFDASPLRARLKLFLIE